MSEREQVTYTRVYELKDGGTEDFFFIILFRLAENHGSRWLTEDRLGEGP